MDLQVDYSDIQSLRMLTEELNLKSQEWAVARTEKLDAETLLLRAKAKLELIQSARDNVLEQLRCKKLEITVQPR